MATILFMSAGVTDGCTWYRCLEPARVLRERGHDARCQPHGFRLGELLAADVVVFQRTYEVRGLQLLKLLRDHREETGEGPTLVYEVDDDLFSIPEHFGGLHALFAQPSVRATMKACIRLADRVTVTNEHLADALRHHTNGHPMPEPLDVRVVPNWVPERYVVEQPPELGGVVTIGWAGSVTHRKDWEQLYVPLRGLLREREDVAVHIMGDPWPAARLRTAARPEQLRATDWATDVDGYLRSLDFHVGLAPLEDSVFNRSKSDVKLKEYAARGIVPVASLVGPYFRSDVPFFSPHPDHWHSVLLELAEDRAQLQGKAAHALDWARANTLEKHAGDWEDALL